MNMKISPNDISNQELLVEIRKVSAKTDELSEKTDRLFKKTDELSHKTDQLSAKTEGLSSRIDENHTEAMEVIHGLAQHMDDRFVKVEDRLDGIETEQRRMRAVMVTKDYLDEKLAIQHSDIMQHTKLEISKVARGG